MVVPRYSIESAPTRLSSKFLDLKRRAGASFRIYARSRACIRLRSHRPILTPTPLGIPAAVHRRRWTHARRHDPSVGQQERRAADRLPPRCSPSSRSCSRTSRAFATVETLVELIASLGVDVEWTERNTLAHPREDRAAERRSIPSCARRSARRSCSPGRCSRAAAAIDAAAAGRRRHRPPSRRHALSRARAARRRRSSIDDELPADDARAARRGRLSRRAERHRHRERAHGGESRATGTTIAAQRRERAARPGPLRTFSSRSAPRSTGSARTRSRSTAAVRCTARRIASGPITSRSARSSGSPRSTRSEIRIADAGVEHLRSTLHGLRATRHRRARSTATISSCRPSRSRMIQSDLGGHVPKLEDQPWPAFPADHDVDRDRHGDAVRGADPHAREDVRVAPVLRRQADRHGRAHRAVRSASRARRRAVAAARQHASSRRTFAPAWRCSLAALCADGESTINNVGQIERGYERIDERLRALGARITRVEDRRELTRLRHPPAELPARERVPEFEAFGITAFTTTRAAGSFGTQSDEPVRDVMARWDRSARIAAGARARGAARFATAAQVHGTRVRGARRRVGGLAARERGGRPLRGATRHGAGGHDRGLRPGVHRASRRARSRCCTRGGAARRRASSIARIAAFSRAGLSRRGASRAHRPGDLRQVLRGERRCRDGAHGHAGERAARRSICAR